MKKSSIASLFIGVLMLSGCQREAPVAEQGLREIRITASVEGVTKATATAFEEGDRIGLTIGDPVGISNRILMPDGERLNPESPLYWPADMPENQEAAFIAFYPYEFSTYTDVFDVTKTWIFGIGSAQYKTSEFQLQDYMAAVTSASPAESSVDLRFKHLMSRFDLTVVDNLKHDTFSGVQADSFRSVEINEIMPWFEINFAEQRAAALEDGGSLHALYPAKMGDGLNYVLILPPQEASPEIVLTLTSGETITYEASAPITFPSGKKVSAVLTLTDNRIYFNYQMEDWTDDPATLTFVETKTPPKNEIWYTSIDGEVVEPYEEASFGDVEVVFNVYENGRGVIRFSGDVTEIGDKAFVSGWSYGTGRLKSIAIPEGCKTIGEDAFQYQESLEEILLPQSLQYLGDMSLYGCRSLKEITLPDGLLNIGSYAFCYCELLQEVTIPQSVQSMGGGVFADCTGLVRFRGKFADASGRALTVGQTLLAVAPSGLTSYRVPEGITYIASCAFAGFENLTEVVLPEGLLRINLQAFSGCTGLTEMTIPESVTSLGSGAFRSCTNLKTVNIPSGITVIPSELFSRCGSLQSIVVPEGVTAIGQLAFASCEQLASVVIPASVTSIGSDAFEDCSGLAFIRVNAATPPTGANEMFVGTDCPIYVPAGSVQAYKTAEFWSGYANRIQAIE